VLVNFLITTGVLIVGLMFLGFFGFIWAIWKRNKNAKLTEGHIKGIFFAPGINKPIEEILTVESSGLEVKAPMGHHIGLYYLNRQAMYNTMYPSIPPLGITFTQVPIQTQWWGLDNPEPLCAHEHSQVATASRIFASGDSALLFMFRQAKAELDKERQEFTKLVKTKLNPTAIYVGLFIIVAGVAVNSFILFSLMSLVKDVATAVGVVVK
jgi:hypothetical protein